MAKPPSLRRRRAGAALKRLREEAGLTLEQAAALTDGLMSKAKIGRIEIAVGAMNGDDALILCRAYGVDHETTEALAELARQSRRRGWWHVYNSDVLGRLVDFVELESDATSVREFQIDLIPGLLQTEDYAAAVIGNDPQAPMHDEVAQRVRVRMERQKRARDRGLRLWGIVHEAALRQPIGGPAVMADQLDQLATRAAEDSAVRVQVLPMSTQGHVAMGMPFYLLDLADGTTVGWIDTQTGGMYLEDKPDTERYGATWSLLAGHALGFTESADMIRRAADEHRGAGT